MEKPGADGHEFMEPEEWASWTALLLLHRKVLQDLDTELRRDHRMAVTEFDVLITLFNAPGRRLGMSALAHQAMLSPAGTTHLVTRLERDGLVRRSVDPADGRKWFTVLTEQGDRRLRAARRTHNAVLRRSFLSVTSAADRQTLRELWQRLSQDQPELSSPERETEMARLVRAGLTSGAASIPATCSARWPNRAPDGRAAPGPGFPGRLATITTVVT